MVEGWWVVFASFGFALISESFGLQAINLLIRLLVKLLIISVVDELSSSLVRA